MERGSGVLDLVPSAGRAMLALCLIRAVARAAFLEGHQLLPVDGKRRGALGRAVRGRWRGRELRGVGLGKPRS